MTETYLQLRHLEDAVLSRLNAGQTAFSLAEAGASIARVSLNQFYGIEINDFAVKVSEAALWISRLKANGETGMLLALGDDDFPLRESAHVHLPQIPRVQPAFRVERSVVSLGLEISGTDGRALHQDFSLRGDAYPCAAHRRSHGANAMQLQGVHGDRGAGFRHAVALQHVDADSAIEMSQALAQGAATGNHELASAVQQSHEFAVNEMLVNGMTCPKGA